MYSVSSICRDHGNPVIETWREYGVVSVDPVHAV